MAASPRQIEANRRNALLSTGPKSEEGKNRSRGNALKHGLAGEGIALTAPAEEIVAERMERWRGVYEIEGELDEFYLRTLVASSVQMEISQNDEVALRNHHAARASAEGSWRRDRYREAVRLGRRLPRDPEVVHDLVATPYGCEWLLKRWGRLARAAVLGPWSESQETTAFDLLGVPHVFREGESPCEPGESPAELAAREIERLEAIRDEQAAVDDHRRELTELGFDPEADPRIDRLRRYDLAATRRFRWAQSFLKLRTATAAPLVAFEPEPETKPVALPVESPPPPTPKAPELPSRTPTDEEYQAAERSFWTNLVTSDDPALDALFAQIDMAVCASRESASVAMSAAPARHPAHFPANRQQRRAAESLARSAK